MENPIQNYWRIRLARVQEELQKNNFQAFVAESAAEAKRIINEEILPRLEDIKTVARGDSLSFEATSLLPELTGSQAFDFLDPFAQGLPEEEGYERGRQALLADLFFSGTNAVTESGILVNLDGWGNRVAALTFGPRHVIVLAGRNKIVPGLDEAMQRIRNYAAPVNAMRLETGTPCAKTSFCEDCRSPARICSSWTITEKSFPRGRIKVILINEDLGL
ncbi:MAG: lactate utilization protein [Desulfohalobiaceae bacterium]|nr:lactate utilization protein [Desulfohalobiaceae bacterium]